MAPFVIFGLPRSRTAWLSRFLTYGDWVCGHEELRHMRSLEDIGTWFSQPNVGTAETAAAPWWRLLHSVAPDARVVVVRRPVGEVFDSLMRLEGVALEPASLLAGLKHLDRKLDQIEARVPGAISVRFEDLAQEDTCARIFEHCLPHRHDHDHWARLDATNVQIDMRALMRYFTAHRAPLEKLGVIAKHYILRDMALREPIDPDGIMIQSESFDAWLRDGTACFNEHLVQVGEAPGDWHAKNIPLMRRLYELGAMQIMTARCNGRMFGYLMTLITPSLTSEHVVSAMNTTFFADQSIPGLGLKIQRAALKALQSRSVNEVFFEAGTRGSGPRLGSLYKRLGAQDHGHVYRLQLAKAA